MIVIYPSIQKHVPYSRIIIELIKRHGITATVFFQDCYYCYHKGRLLEKRWIGIAYERTSLTNTRLLYFVLITLVLVFTKRRQCFISSLKFAEVLTWIARLKTMKYIVEVRDLLRRYDKDASLASKVIEGSQATIISSPQFNKHFSEAAQKKMHVHFNAPLGLKVDPSRITKQGLGPYIVVYAGHLRELGTLYRLLSNSTPSVLTCFKFQLFGSIEDTFFADLIKRDFGKYVVFEGEYTDENIVYKKVDFVYAMVDPSIYNSKLLLTNRLSHAVFRNVPVIVNKWTCQGDFVSKFNIGFVLTEDDGLEKLLIDRSPRFLLENFELARSNIRLTNKITEDVVSGFLK